MTTETIHPALAQAPKTLREALERAQRYLADHVPAKGVYAASGGNCCIVGQFFTPEQLADIKARNLNTKPTRFLVKAFGVRNLKAMTGMSPDQLEALQRTNDRHTTGTLRAEIDRLLKGQVTYVAGAYFKVKAK